MLTPSLPPLDRNPTAYRVERHAAVYSRARRVVRKYFKALASPVPVGGLGGDVSKWQASVDWQMAKANGWSFVFIRVLYGMAVDSKFTSHWINSKVAGLKRGAYAYYLDAEDPEDQAQKLYDTLAATGNLGDLPVVADIEEYGNVQITPAKVKKYLEKLTSLFGAGNVIVYTGKSVWDTWIGDVAWAKAYPLWLAQYTLVGWQEGHLEKVRNYPPTPPKPWVFWDDDADAPLAGYVAIWQFTASCPAELYGVSGTVVDLDYVSPAFAKKHFGGGPPPIVPPPTPGDDMTQPIKCVTLGAYINTRAQPSANAVDTGNYYKNEEAVCFPEKTFVKKADLPNKEIWRLVLKTDGTVGWAAEWHPTIKNAAGQQYAAIVDLAPPAPPVPTVLLQAIGDVNLRYYSETNAQGHPIMKLPPVGSRPKFINGAQIVAHPTLINADGTVDYYQVLNGHLATPATYTPPAGHTGWFVSELEVILL